MRSQRTKSWERINYESGEYRVYVAQFTMKCRTSSVQFLRNFRYTCLRRATGTAKVEDKELEIISKLGLLGKQAETVV